jgi:hypothetical protein
MGTQKPILSVGGQHVLNDMVELQMYLVAQSQQAPWPMLPRTKRTIRGDRTPYRNPVEPGAAKELLDRGFIEPTSNRTFVVSKSGFEFYKQEREPSSG